MAVLLVLATGIFYLHWKDMHVELPLLQDLQTVTGREFTSQSGGPRYLEYYDAAGKRYQLPDLTREQYTRLDQALHAGQPVIMRYGPWRNALHSDNIFSVYQVEIGPEILYPYAEIERYHTQEVRDAPWILLVSILFVIIGVPLMMIFVQTILVPSVFALLRRISAQ